ncbi:MAG: caspase family protein [Myxococcota bacterium]
MRHRALLLWAVVCATPAEAKRIAVVVGNNEAAGEEVELRYAERDAQSIRDVLAELGGVTQTYAILNRGPDALRRAFSAVETDLAQEKEPVTLFFYYSGHADDRALLMRDGRFELSELRARLGSLPVDLFVAVVDACQSGALLRRKGGTSVPLVNLELYQEDLSQRGGVFITAGSAGEAAQESDEIGGSFFTHSLVSALRGAADDSQDGRISLEEAYRFAYAQTLDRTRTTMTGPQHPSWEVNIRGQGQLVITWLDTSRSYLILDEATSGRWMFRDLIADRVAVELSKSPGKKLRVALEPGRYEVLRVDEAALLHQVVQLDAGLEVLVDAAKMVPGARSMLRSKGVPRGLELGAALHLGSGYLTGADGSLGATLFGALDLSDRVRIELRASVDRGTFRRVDQLDVETVEFGGSAGAAVRLAELERMMLWAGADLDLRAVLERGRTELGSQEQLSATSIGPEVRATAEFPLVTWLTLAAEAGGAARVYQTAHGFVVRPEAIVEVGLRVRP